MRNIAEIGLGRAAGLVEPGRSTWLRVVLARCVASLAIAVAVATLPVFQPRGIWLAVVVVVVGALLNAAALDALRRGRIPGLFLPLGDLLLALLIVATVPKMLAVAAIVFTSVTTLYVVWYGVRASVALAASAVIGLSVIGALEQPLYWIPTVVCLAICSATTIAVMDAICAGVNRAHSRFGDLINGLDAVVWEKDRYGHKSFVSDNVSGVVGTTRESFMSPGFLASRVHPDDRADLDHARALNEAGHPSESHFRVLDDCGHYRHLYERVSVWHSTDGRVQGSRGLLVDESARWGAQAVIRRYADFISGIPVALMVMRLADRSDPWSMEVVSLNPAAQRMFGHAPIGTPLNSLVPLPESWTDRLARVAEGTEPLEQAFVEIPEVDGVFAVRVVPLPEQHVGVAIEDVTKRARMAESFRHQARHDSLTGLANRTLLYERLAEVFDDVEEPTAALFIIDLDDFKTVNDSMGHEYGDQVLSHFATRLNRRLRNCDLVARLGGDEFAIILTDCFGEAHAADMARRVVEICESPFDIGGYELRVGASVGVAVAPRHGTEAARLLRHADAAMYAAKARGGGAVLYSPEVDTLPSPPGLQDETRGDRRTVRVPGDAWGNPITPQ